MTEHAIPIPGRHRRRTSRDRVARQNSDTQLANVSQARAAFRSNPLFRMTPMSSTGTSTETSTHEQPVPSPSTPAHVRRRSADFAYQYPHVLHQELSNLFSAGYDGGRTATSADPAEGEGGSMFQVDHAIFNTDEDLEQMHDITARRLSNRND